jgi:hypothetical protein
VDPALDESASRFEPGERAPSRLYHPYCRGFPSARPCSWPDLLLPDIDTILTTFKRVIISMQDMSTQRASLHKVLELRNGHPDLVDTLLEAYHCGCPVADASLDLVALLAAGENRIDGHHNRNMLTAEHVVSVLPGNAMTTTAIYRAIEFMTLKHSQATVIPPLMLQAWEEHKTNTAILRYLAQTFISNTHNIALLKTVYVLPQVKVVEGLAICSITPTYCSTLLTGTAEAIEELENFLRSLLKSLFRTKQLFSWNRYCKLPIHVNAPKQKVGWEYTKNDDVGAILFGMVQDSIATGCKSLEELIVYGRASKEIYDPDSLRLQCVQCLTSSESAMVPGLHEARAQIDNHDVDAEDANFDNDFSTFESDSVERGPERRWR